MTVINHGPATRRRHKRCQVCDRFFYPTQRYHKAKFCSIQCAGKGRDRASRVAAGRKGGNTRAERLGAMRQETLRHALEGKSALDGYALGREHGRRQLDNRMQTAKREGFSEGYTAGYDAAMQDARQSA